MGFRLPAAGHRSIAQDTNVAKYRRDEVGFCDLRKRREFILRGVEVLNDKLDRTAFFLDYSVIAILVSLNSATKMSNLAESPLYAFLEYCCSLAVKGVSRLASYTDSLIMH